jgi:hypothetical protein
VISTEPKIEPEPATSPQVESLPLNETPNDEHAEQVIATEPSPKRALTPPPFLVQPAPVSKFPDFWMWVGAGANYTQVTQSAPGFTDLRFDTISTPSIVARGGFFFAENLGLELNYRSTPGEVKQSESLAVSGGSYQWRTLSSELLVRPWASTNESRWLIRFGVQQHQLPFLIPTRTSSVDVIDASLTTVSLGADYSYHFKKLRIEWQGRYLYPVRSMAPSSRLEMNSQIALDGSVGAVAPLSERVKIGVYWYGQFQKYKFEYEDGGQNGFSGTSEFFQSTLDFRIGVEF